jgi:hypothetical protein
MSVWLHSTVLATTLAATAAVGVAGATYYSSGTYVPSEKSDRLVMSSGVCRVVDASARIACDIPRKSVTLESRDEEAGVSVLTSVPVAEAR